MVAAAIFSVVAAHQKKIEISWMTYGKKNSKGWLDVCIPCLFTCASLIISVKVGVDVQMCSCSRTFEGGEKNRCEIIRGVDFSRRPERRNRAEYLTVQILGQSTTQPPCTPRAHLELTSVKPLNQAHWRWRDTPAYETKSIIA